MKPMSEAVIRMYEQAGLLSPEAAKRRRQILAENKDAFWSCPDHGYMGACPECSGTHKEKT